MRRGACRREEAEGDLSENRNEHDEGVVSEPDVEDRIGEQPRVVLKSYELDWAVAFPFRETEPQGEHQGEDHYGRVYDEGW
jgi:hypothetical protein